MKTGRQAESLPHVYFLPYDGKMLGRPGVTLRARAATAFCVVVLVALNAWILGRLFKIEYTPWMGSIEGAYVGLSRWLQGHWTDLGWFPLWYGGIPLENAYPPLLHIVVAAAAQASGISPARA